MAALIAAPANTGIVCAEFVPPNQVDTDYETGESRQAAGAARLAAAELTEYDAVRAAVHGLCTTEAREQALSPIHPFRQRRIHVFRVLRQPVSHYQSAVLSQSEVERVVNERSKQAELANGMDSQSKSKPMPRFSALGSITPLDVRIIVRL